MKPTQAPKRMLRVLIVFFLVASSFALPAIYSFNFEVTDRTSGNAFSGIVSSQLLDDGVRLSGILNSSALVYFENDKAYSVTNGTTLCVPSNSFFSSDSIYQSMLANTTIPFDKIKDELVLGKCQNCIVYAVEALEETYLLCVDNTSFVPKAVISETFIATIFNYLPSVRPLPGLNSTFLNSCPTSYTTILVSLNSGWWTYSQARAKRQLAENKPYQKNCIFLHGAGEEWPAGTLTTSSMPDYWGQMEKYTPQCKSRIFIRENTRARGWKDLELQKKYCEVASQFTGTISNVIIFAHSMGNLILAAALENKFCVFDKKTAKWFNIQGPLEGSDVANFLESTCALTPTLFSQIPQAAAQAFKYCNGTKLAPVYTSLRTSEKKWFKWNNILQEYVAGALCGTTPIGLVSTDAFKLTAVYLGLSELTIGHDGMVPVYSCVKKNILKTFSGSPTNEFYLADINHSDGRCKNGDGYFSQARKPCSFYICKGLEGNEKQDCYKDYRGSIANIANINFFVLFMLFVFWVQ